MKIRVNGIKYFMSYSILIWPGRFIKLEYGAIVRFNISTYEGIAQNDGKYYSVC